MLKRRIWQKLEISVIGPIIYLTAEAPNDTPAWWWWRARVVLRSVSWCNLSWPRGHCWWTLVGLAEMTYTPAKEKIVIMIIYMCMYVKTVYVVIFRAVVLFSLNFASQTSWKCPLQFMSIYNENIRKITEINPSRIPAPSPKSRKISVRENYGVYGTTTRCKKKKSNFWSWINQRVWSQFHSNLIHVA